MFKFIFLSLMALFMLIGVVLLFSDLGNLSNNEAVVAATVQQNDNSELPNDAYADFAMLVADKCVAQGGECFTVKAYGEAKRKYSTKPQAIAHLLKSRGVQYEQTVDGKVYACGLDPQKLYEEIKRDYSQNPYAERKAILKKGGVWKVDVLGNGRGEGYYRIYAKGSGRFDLLTFQSEKAWLDHRKGVEGQFMFDCSVFDTLSFDASCLIGTGSIIAVISKDDDNSFSGGVFKSGFSLKNIKLKQSADNKMCIDVELGF